MRWQKKNVLAKASIEFYGITLMVIPGGAALPLSLNRNKDTDQAVVRLEHFIAERRELKNMPKHTLAVLRSIVQLEISLSWVLSDCTQLSIAEITGIFALLRKSRLHWLEWREGKNFRSLDFAHY